MNTRLAANLSVLFTACMLVLSFSFGFHNYSEAQKAIVSDLNQALQQTIMQNSGLWMNQDTLKTYSRLSSNCSIDQFTRYVFLFLGIAVKLSQVIRKEKQF